MTPAFVAEARRVYVPAARWMRANGFSVRSYGGSFGASLAATSETCDVEIYEVTQRGGSSRWQLRFGTVDVPESRVYMASMQAAVDFLVTAGVLPESMHSLHGGYVPAIDDLGDSVWQDDETGEVITAFSGDEGVAWEPLFRRVAAEVDMESTDPITVEQCPECEGRGTNCLAHRTDTVGIMARSGGAR